MRSTRRRPFGLLLASLTAMALMGCSTTEARPTTDQSSSGQVPDLSTPSNTPMAADESDETSGVNASTSWIPADFAPQFAAKAEQLGAQASLGLADLAGGPALAIGGFDTPYAYSTIKIPMVATLLRLQGEPSTNQMGQIAAALSASDNSATRALYDDIIAISGDEQAATSAIEGTLAITGDSATEVPTAAEIPDWPARQAVGVVSTYGQTLWSTEDQAAFVAELMQGCVVPAAQLETIRSAMANVVPGQQWGLGQVAGVRAFKGGWGQDANGVNFFVRQVAEVSPSEGGPYVIALAVALDQPSSVASGSVVAEAAVLQELGSWTVEQLGPAPASQPCEAAGEEQ